MTHPTTQADDDLDTLYLQYLTDTGQADSPHARLFFDGWLKVYLQELS